MLLKSKSLDFSDQNFEDTYRRVLRKHGYQFSQIIGRGGMSRVDEVHHLATGMLRAIKHLGPNPPPEKVDRFKRILRRETEYAFDHPNVMKGLDLFEENGDIFYVMPRLQHNLEYLLQDDEKYSLMFLLDVLIQIAAGMNYLHQNRIIHRDMKPSNILYDFNGSATASIVICDFGLSQDKGAKFKTDLWRFFGRGRRAGTMSYAAPEQMRKGGKYDKRCDIYSLGRVMDELIAKKMSGSGKFINTFQQDRVLHALSKKVYLYKMERPFILDAVERGHLPYSLSSLILRCLQKHPDRRPPDVVQIFYELTKIQQECRAAEGSEFLQKEVLTYRPRQ
jgi:serine/threonine protein kinase